MSWVIGVVQWCISCVDSNHAVAPTIGVVGGSAGAVGAIGALNNLTGPDVAPPRTQPDPLLSPGQDTSIHLVGPDPWGKRRSYRLDRTLAFTSRAPTAGGNAPMGSGGDSNPPAPTLPPQPIPEGTGGIRASTMATPHRTDSHHPVNGPQPIGDTHCEAPAPRTWSPADRRHPTMNGPQPIGDTPPVNGPQPIGDTTRERPPTDRRHPTDESRSAAERRWIDHLHRQHTPAAVDHRPRRRSTARWRYSAHKPGAHKPTLTAWSPTPTTRRNQCPIRGRRQVIPPSAIRRLRRQRRRRSHRRGRTAQ